MFQTWIKDDGPLLICFLQAQAELDERGKNAVLTRKTYLD